METLNDRTPRNGTSGLRGPKFTAALLAVAAGACWAVAQPITQTRPQPPQGVDQSGTVSVDDNFTVELHVRDEDLANVLQLLSLQSQKSIIAGPNVNAAVTANLYGVTFYEALDAVLHSYGYDYIEQGNMIYVMTKEEAAKAKEQGRLPQARIVRLSYLSAVDAAEYVSPLLSEVGEIRTNGPTEDFTVSDDTPENGDDYAGDAMMIVFDYEENVNEILALVSQIDTRPQQVLVEATVLQAQLTEANAFGIDFSLIGDLDFSEFVGNPLNVVNRAIGGTRATDGDVRGLQSTVGQTAQPGGLKIGIVDNDVAIFMRVLDEVTDTTVISNPKILLLNRQEGRVQVGRRIGYLEVTTTDTSTQQNVKFLDTGTQLSFRPFITQDNLIRMELRPEVSRPFLRTVTDTNGNPVTIPDEDTSEIVTNVFLREGQTAVLGGLFTESTVTSRRQVPLLGDIPILGTPFRGHDDTVERSEVIFMVKPTIMSDDQLIEQGQRGMAYVERVRTGAREGLLPFSRERQSSQHLVRAERLAAEGDMDGALWCVRRALALNPAQPDAIRLRERLLSQPTVWPSRSMAEDIVNNEVDTRIRAARQQAFAEFTSLTRPDNRWNDLNTRPSPAVTNAEPLSDSDDFQTPANSGSFQEPQNDSGSIGSPQSSNTGSPQPNPGAAAYSWTYYMNQQAGTQPATGEAAPSQSANQQTASQPTPTQDSTSQQGVTAQGTTASNSASQGGTSSGASPSSPTTPSQTAAASGAPSTANGTNPGGSAQPTQPSQASAEPAHNPSDDSFQPSASSVSRTQQPQAQSPTSSTTARASQQQMYPFLQAPAQQTSQLPNVQPDANGFYPITAMPTNTASNVTGNAQNQAATQTRDGATITPPTSVYGRMAWIFGVKARSSQPFQSPTVVNAEESSSSQNP